MAACTQCSRYEPSTSAGWADAPTDVVAPATAHACVQVACMACGIVQCHSNGLQRGTCRHCHYGMLPGWSGNRRDIPCSYKGCQSPSVYRHMGNGKPNRCASHGKR